MAHSKMAVVYRLLTFLTLTALFFPALSLGAGLVEDEKAKNQSLLVRVGHGLPGLDIDVKNLERVSKYYGYEPAILAEKQGTSANVKKMLTELSKAAQEDGSLLFYFTGHGTVGKIMLQDVTIPVKDLRTALEAGRKGLTPLKRLTLIFDSCYSGSLLGPFRKAFPWHTIDSRMTNARFVNNVVQEFSNDLRAPYWEKLFVFASSKADETSLASDEGSIFTLAFIKAFDESIAAKETVGTFIQKTQKYTEGHNPVARLVPETINDERL